jgi:hypothetical protein
MTTPSSCPTNKPRSLSDSPASSSDIPVRKRRKARTNEEKAVRAEERAVRNRRAAQESRDRKRQAFEALERENVELRAENELLRQILESMERRVNVIEAQGQIAETHPAEVMSFDQQCRTIMSLRHSQTSTRCLHFLSRTLRKEYMSDFQATDDGLNTGSLHPGAEATDNPEADARGIAIVVNTYIVNPFSAIILLWRLKLASK